MLGMVGVPATVYATGHLRDARRAGALAALTGLFHLALIGVLVARDAVTLLGCWEAMTLVPAAAILVAHDEAPARRAVFEYLAITHIGGAGVWVAVLTLAQHGALGDPGGIAAAGAGMQALVAVAGIVGFGTKAGLVPLHSWLPRAHPIAPSHLSAVMSGVMIKVALYGLVRLLGGWLGPPPLWVGLAVLAVGAASALAGAVYALFQTGLKRLLAFSSIENAGIVAMALGAWAVLADRGEQRWAALALAGALLHALAHAAFKGLLFLAAGTVERAAGTVDLDRLGGLLRRLPASGAAMLTGCLAIAGVPLLAGFASEWVVLQALLRLGRDGAPGIAVAGALGVATLAATAALAAACFAGVAGLVLLGRPRTDRAAAAREPGRAMAGAVVALAGACLALGVVPGLLLPSLAALAPGGAGLGRGAGPAVPGTSLPTLAVAAALAVLVGVVWLLRGRARPAPAPAWACGQDLSPALLWTSSAFTKPLRLMLAGVLRPERSVEVVARGGVVREVRHRGGVPHLFDALLYAPAVRAALAGAAAARRLQSGRLRGYVGSMVGLVLLLLLLARTGALG
ncbi:MAG: proton-conducting transporter membrane subunit [Thermoleophilia bacterium]